ncbi:MAG: UDP-2,3-diacylglucosamine diphosphatase LpxI [Rhodospirillales bacterium]|nr:UDP-2,3-diacylglucosamine diphosphatase LpxI [Rhodospirillales bacterium]MCW8861854.1 UDP-2,3-diacylglucosamine diphosphatase LpxI [Rhodospirillales bacterium]MCW8953163.1 UDP-2,3-diacylglucosamine diphosphatase LpxI [Rhodospirillales bacterium]MCW8969634.1 UDP-2,3-diacylglucosamine diphosphatase LpxI [Rhodospirillales bacterium]MCW9003166.1 UDP-2,3-diacylglucosamine diphosphatase LpxI [Rhodospirillales bacterium]
MQPKLGIVAGGGDLPKRLIAACRASDREVFVLAIRDQADPDTVNDVPCAWVRLGAAGEAIRTLRDNGVLEVVLAGNIRRPSMSELRPDAKALKLFMKAGAASLGDDGLLSVLVKDLEENEGFKVVGAEDVMAELLAVSGTYGRVEPDGDAMADIQKGIRIARAIGALDIGQGAIVQQGIVLGVEAIEGTDAMIDRCAQLSRSGPGGVLVKVSKPGQERRADLPTIGVETVRNAAKSGLRGIAIEAGGALVVGRDQVIAAADETGLFVVGVDITDKRA